MEEANMGATVSHQYPVMGRNGQPEEARNTKFRVVAADVTYYRFENDLLSASAAVYTTDDCMVYIRLNDVVSISRRGTYMNVLAKRDCDLAGWRQASIREGTTGVRPTFIPIEDAVRLAEAHVHGPLHDSAVSFFKDIRRTIGGLRDGKYEAYGLKDAVCLPTYLSFLFKERRTKRYIATHPSEEASSAVEIAPVQEDTPEPEPPPVHQELAPAELAPEVREELCAQLGHLIMLRQDAQKKAEMICKVLDIPVPW